jgi:hypothetical protein
MTSCVKVVVVVGGVQSIHHQLGLSQLLQIWVLCVIVFFTKVWDL